MVDAQQQTRYEIFYDDSTHCSAKDPTLTHDPLKIHHIFTVDSMTLQQRWCHITAKFKQSESTKNKRVENEMLLNLV